MLWLTGDRELGESSAGEPDKENRESVIRMGSQETRTWVPGGADQTAHDESGGRLAKECHDTVELIQFAFE